MKRNRLVQSVSTILAGAALLAGTQARSFAQLLNGPPPPGKTYIIQSSLLDSSGNAYILDDPAWGGSGTQVDLWQFDNGSNQFWLLNNVGGNTADYYTIQAYWNQGLCLDCSNSGTAPGTVVQVWDCNGTGAQNWAFQTPGSNQPYVIVPRNAYWMALDAPGASDGALLTIESQSGSSNEDWDLVGMNTSDIDGNGNWCAGNVAACTMSVLAGGVVTITSGVVISQAWPQTSISAVEEVSETQQASADLAANQTALQAKTGQPAVTESQTGVTYIVTKDADGNTMVVTYRTNGVSDEEALSRQATAVALFEEAGAELRVRLDGIDVLVTDDLDKFGK